jgi:hypothetical protein
MSDETEVPPHIKKRSWAAQIFDKVRSRQPVAEPDRVRAKEIIDTAKAEDERLANTSSTEKAQLVDQHGNIYQIGPDGRMVKTGTLTEEKAATMAKQIAARLARERWLDETDENGTKRRDWDPNAA